MYGAERKPSVLEVDHDIDTQSIYGFDQMIHRQPSINRLDQATIARNFSKRTLCSIPQNIELGFEPTHQYSENHSLNDRPLRWFESGSIGSVNLGSSIDIFKESIPVDANQQKSSVFLPIFNKHRKTSNIQRPLFYDGESKIELNPTLSVPGKLNAMSNIEEVPTPDESVDNDKHSCLCSAFKWIVQFFDLDLLQDKIYVNIMVGMAISIFAEINFAILTPFILSDLKFDSDSIADILLVMAIADLITRFCCPFVADRFDISIRMSYLISLGLLVITRMCK